MYKMSYRSSAMYLMTYSRHYFGSVVCVVVPGMRGIFCAFHSIGFMVVALSTETFACV